jgi:hypothetical protein
MSAATMPEDRHPRLPEFEGNACEVVVDGERVPGLVRAIYRPSEDHPDKTRAVVETDESVRDVPTDRDCFEVLLS